MRTFTVAGGWYGDSTPTGQAITLVTKLLLPDGTAQPSHLQLNEATIIPFAQADPTLAPLFVRFREDAGAFAGQAADADDVPMEYVGAQWGQREGRAWGVSPVIYDLAGVLQIAREGGPAGSQGYRSVTPDGTPTGRIVYGDETYGPTPQAPLLYQWTDLSVAGEPRLVIGQEDGERGVLVLDGTTYRRFASGRCFTVRGRRTGQQCSVTYYRELGGQLYECVHSWPTVAALRALPPVVAPPIPIPPIPPEVPVSVPMPADVVALVRRFALAFPPPWGPAGPAHENRCRQWMGRLAEQIRLERGDPAWGHKSTAAGSPPSKDVLARRWGSTIDGWDILKGAGTGSPVLSDPPAWVDISDQFFITVGAIDHLNGVAVPSGRPALPPGPGLTSFNLGERLEQGDDAWLMWCRREGITRPRVIIARTPSAPTPAVGLLRLPLTLAKLAAFGMQAEMVLLADTAVYGLTEADCLQWVRDCVAQLELQPDGVGSVQGANEPEHPTQQPFIRNVAFMAQVAALVPRRFAYTDGPSTHGGESAGVTASYLTTHGARNQTPYVNADLSEQLEIDTGLPVVEDEPIGVAEVAVPGSRTNDPDYGRQLADACRTHGLGGATLHLQAGLTANVDDLGPIQRAALRGFVKRWNEGVVPGPVPIPVPLPPPPAGPGVLRPGDRIRVDVPLVSQDGRFRLLYQQDGNLVLYGPTGPRWASNTRGSSVGSCDLQGDGNFVLYDAAVRPRWATGTNGKPGAWLLLQNDGNLVLYRAGVPIWATGTNG
jgi:hypothetical protein